MDAPEEGEQETPESGTPMERFRTFARRLVAVPNTEVEEQQEVYEQERNSNEEPES